MSMLLLKIFGWAARRMYESIYHERVESIAFFCPSENEWQIPENLRRFMQRETKA